MVLKKGICGIFVILCVLCMCMSTGINLNCSSLMGQEKQILKKVKRFGAKLDVYSIDDHSTWNDYMNFYHPGCLVKVDIDSEHYAHVYFDDCDDGTKYVLSFYKDDLIGYKVYNKGEITESFGVDLLAHKENDFLNTEDRLTPSKLCKYY